MDVGERYPVKSVSLPIRTLRRVVDICLGFSLLAVSTPIFLLAALAVWIESEGNPFFIQERIGLGGQPFKMVKLRGMYIDARSRFPHLYDYAKFGDLNFHFHYEHDPRITRVGAFIRKTSIDELPNFINVLFGEMTLVGPRPEIPDVLALYGESKAGISLRKARHYLSLQDHGAGQTDQGRDDRNRFGLRSQCFPAAGSKHLLADDEERHSAPGCLRRCRA